MLRLKYLKILAGCLQIAFLLVSCPNTSIDQGIEFTEEMAAKIIDGKTTKQEILAQYGEPTTIRYNETLFLYSWTRQGPSHSCSHEKTAYTKSLVVEFDREDVLKSHFITRGIVEKLPPKRNKSDNS
jgi:outer membrane protein assembly factor BamE (lipoprotein component of BamABCDE complex)